MTNAARTNGASHPLVDAAIDDSSWVSDAGDHWNGGDAALIDFADRAVRAALSAIDISDDAVSISVLFADDDRMRDLNASFRGHDKSTNVLSWPAFPLDAPLTTATFAALSSDSVAERLFMGDLALGFETVRAEAEAAEKTLEDHTAHLIVHGVLHLFGFSHEMDEDAVVMERREAEALGTLGVADPYAVGAAS